MLAGAAIISAIGMTLLSSASVNAQTFELNSQRKAFLDTLSYAEGTANDDSYFTLFGGDKFSDCSSHPSVYFVRKYNSGDSGAAGWERVPAGVSISDSRYENPQYPQYVPSGGTLVLSYSDNAEPWFTSAAGRYQFVNTTWNYVSKVIEAKDFCSESQDRGALYLLSTHGSTVLSNIDNERFDEVVDAVKYSWESLALIKNGSYSISYSQLKSYYEKQLEYYADTGYENFDSENCNTLKSKSWSIGDVSEEVRDLQECMTDLGYFTYAYGSTGYYGPITQTALDEWKGLGVNVDCNFLKTQIWKIGQAGQNVVELQDCMTDAGFFNYSGGSTGYYGPITKAALDKWNGVVIVEVKAEATDKPNITDSSLVCDTQLNKNYKIGQADKNVQLAQECLQESGYYNYYEGVTGYFGSYTRAALNHYLTGSDCNTLYTAASEWNKGKTGLDVRDLQQCLTDLGEYTWRYGITGYYGDYTARLI